MDSHETPENERPSTALVVAGVGIAVAGAIVFFATREKSARGERVNAPTVAALRKISDAAIASRESTIAAFASAEPAEHDALDSRATKDIERLSSVFAEIKSGLPQNAVDLATSIVERYEAAQVQLMSFAINRKNRENTDSLASLENDDRRLFESESAELVSRIQRVISSKRL